ncbi:MAG: 1-acyl-sn-glycerol-3-phosphate acyltransferase [Clostridia bacterium]|nr:1-acyl-sn-glycerol-3-phosphate acyltransferase [Clostridia bacterium]
MSEENQAGQERERTFWYTMARGFTFLMTHLFYPVTYHNAAVCDQAGACIVVANHKHWLDPLLVGSRFKRHEVVFLGKKELVHTKLAERLMKRLHMIVVDRHNSDLKAMRECIQTVRKGHVLGIFPEGTRCRETTLAHLETGCAFIALRCKAPLVPVLIDRPCRLWRRTHVYFGQPLQVEELYQGVTDAAAAEEMNRRIRAGILALSPAPRLPDGTITHE